MEYTIQSLSNLAGVSSRTLRYYDEIGLLKPVRIAHNGYRIYGLNEIDKLQQILFYKTLGVELEKIKSILEDESFDSLKAMQQHLKHLQNEQSKLVALIENVNTTIKSLKGETTMSDKQKFEAFKDNLIKENNEKYGDEVIEKYGKKEFDASNAKLKNATKEDWDRVEKLSEKLNLTLKQACASGDFAGETAQQACAMHKEWISFFWQSYSKDAHLGLCTMYTQDERFKVYYENIAPGCAEFLLKAMEIYLK